MQENLDFEITLRPRTGWLSIDLKSVWRYRDLLSLLVWRDFVAKYKQTILGPIWFVIQPLLMTVVFTIVFSKVAKLPTDDLPPILFYLCGQLVWNYFAQCFTSGASTFVNNASLFSKVYFPRLVIPLSAIISNLFTFLIQLGTFFVFFLYFKYVAKTGTFRMSWHVVFLPFVILQIAVLSMGLGLVMSSLTAKYRDLMQLTGLLIQVWMYATPVIYPLSTVPPQWRWVAALNPMTPVVESIRYMLLGTGTVLPEHLACSVMLSLALLIGGLLLFGKVEKTFVDTI